MINCHFDSRFIDGHLLFAIREEVAGEEGKQSFEFQ